MALESISNAQLTGDEVIIKGYIADDAESPNDLIGVRLPTYDMGKIFGPVTFSPRPLRGGGALLPSRNDPCVVALDEDDNAVLISWWAEDPTLLTDLVTQQYVDDAVSAEEAARSSADAAESSARSTADSGLDGRLRLLEQGQTRHGRWNAKADSNLNAIGQGWKWTAAASTPDPETPDPDYFALITVSGKATNSGIRCLQTGRYDIRAQVLTQTSPAAVARHDASLLHYDTDASTLLATLDSSLGHSTAAMGFVKHNLSALKYLTAGQVVFVTNTQVTFGDDSGVWSNIELRFLGGAYIP